MTLRVIIHLIIEEVLCRHPLGWSILWYLGPIPSTQSLSNPTMAYSIEISISYYVSLYNILDVQFNSGIKYILHGDKNLRL